MSTENLHAILMPKWGLAMHEGTIADWQVAVGDSVAAGDAICDIETNKITNEFESPVTGTVVRLPKAVGDVVGVGEVIAVIAEGAASDEDIDALLAQHAAASEDGAEDAGQGGVQTVETDAGVMAYLETGDENAKQTVLFLHGFGGDHSNWGLLQAELPESVRAIALDLPGHGASTNAVGDGSAKALAKSVLAFARAMGLSGVNVVGHSFGANVAAAAAAQNADLARKMVVIAPPAFGAAANEDYIKGFIGARRKKDMRPVLEMLFSDADMVSRTMVNDAIAHYRDDEARNALETIGASLSAASSDVEREVKFARQNGVTIIWGDRDAVVQMPKDLADTVGGNLHLIEGTGHMPHAEKPGKVAEILLGVIGD